MYSSNLLDVRSYRGANIDSDHYLLGAKFRARISNIKKLTSEKQQKKYNVRRFKDQGTYHKFQGMVSKHLRSQEPGTQSMSSTEIWERCKTALTIAGDEAVGECMRRDETRWFDDECMEVTNKKRRL